MGKATHNARLRQLIRDVDGAVGPFSSQQDLLAAVQRVREFNEPLHFDNSTPKTLGILGTLVILAAIAFAQWGSPGAKAWLSGLSRFRYEELLVLLGMAALVCLVICFGLIHSRSNQLPRLSREIARHSSWLTHGLSNVATPAGLLLQQLASQFGDYARGNYSRAITQAVQGQYPGELHSLPYTYYQLHYVNKRVVVTTESNGKGGTRLVTKTVYDHYDRYSLVIDFPWVEGIAARTSGSSALDFEHGIDTASSEFNKAFTLTGGTRMACARFAKPVTVLHLLSMHRQLRKLNLEFSWNRQLCMSFDDSNLLDFQLPCDLTQPEAFYALIQQGVRLHLLSNALGLVHALAEQHDDNFSLPAAAAHQEEH